MVFFNVWAESLDRYIYLKFFLLFVIWVIMFIIFYDFIKLITSIYIKNRNNEKIILGKKQSILYDIEVLLWKNWKIFIKNFFLFLEKNVNIWKYSLETILERVDWKKEDLYEMIYSKEKNYSKYNEEKIRGLLLEYKSFLER